MAPENAALAPPSPFAFQILSSLIETVGKEVSSVINLENGVVFLYNDNTALFLAPFFTEGGEAAEVRVYDDNFILENFEFKNLAKAGLLTQLYVIQTIGKEAGLTIVPATESGDTFRIDFSV
jgi:hypothetical protein